MRQHSEGAPEASTVSGVHLFHNPQFWSIVSIFTLITLHHYDDQTMFRLFAGFDLPLGLTRHTIDRILYLVPVTLSSFIFGVRGGLVTVTAAFAFMLPRAIFISPYMNTAVLETGVITLVGSLAPFWAGYHKKQGVQLQETMVQLKSTQQELDTTVKISKEQRRQLGVIDAFTLMLSQPLRLEQVMNATVDMVMGLTEVDVVLLHSLDKESGRLHLIAHRGILPESAKILDGMKLGDSACGRAAALGHAVRLDDMSGIAGELGEPELYENVQAELSVPLVAHGEIVGTLCVATKSQRQFREADIRLLSALGNLIGVAIRNAHLYQERELATEQLRLSENKYRQLFENAHDAIWVHDLTGKVIAANEAAADLFGYDLSEIIGMESRDLYAHDDYILTRVRQKTLLEVQRRQKPYSQEIVRRDGTKAYVMLTANSIAIAGRPDAIQFIGRDITKEVRMQENQSFYMQQITRAHEDERQRISRDLHDSTAQTLIATLRSLEKFCEEDTELSAPRLERLWDFHGQLKDALHEIRQISRDLRPSIIDNLGLLPAVEWLVEQLKVEYSIDAKFTVEGEERRFTPEVEVTLFRIIQEALRNIARHASATEVQVAIGFRRDETTLTIIDNGKGFELPASLGELSRLGKLGVDGMHTRARLINGTIDMQSRPGGGTAIVVVVPN